MEERSRVLILGVGNRLRGDDGFGSCLAEALSWCGVRGADVEWLDTMHVYAVEYLRGRRLVVVLDVVYVEGAEPGTIVFEEYDVSSLTEDIASEALETMAAHVFTPLHMLIIARELGVFNGRFILAGIVPESLEPRREVVTETLRRRLPEYYGRLKALLEAEGVSMPSTRCVLEAFDRACRV